MEFMDKFSVKKGIVVTKDTVDEKSFDIDGMKVKILFIPA